MKNKNLLIIGVLALGLLTVQAQPVVTITNYIPVTITPITNFVDVYVTNGIPTAAPVPIVIAGVTYAAQGSFTNPPLNFLSQAANWGTSFNTDVDHNWTNNSTLQYDTGIATTTGVGISDRLYAQYDISPKFGVGIMGQFVGVGSPFGAIFGTVQYALIQKFDFKIGLEVDAGYNFNAKDATGAKVGGIEVDPGLFASKKLTANTYATVKYLQPVQSTGKFDPQGVLYIGLGATF